MGKGKSSTDNIMELEAYSKSKESVCPGFVSLVQLIPQEKVSTWYLKSFWHREVCIWYSNEIIPQ